MQPQLTRQDVINIFRTILINFPDKDCCQGLDTFALITGPDDFNSSKFGKSYTDYEKGYFYSKTWVGNGTIKDEMCRKFGALLLEQREMSIVSKCGSNQGTLSWHLTILQNEDCTDCKGQTKSATDDRLNELILQVWSLFMAHELWVDQEGNQYWLTEEHAEFLNNCEELEVELIPHSCELKICECIKTNQIKVYPVEHDFVQGARGLVMSFETQACYDSSVEMKYKCDNKTPEAVAQAMCAKCP